MTHCAYQAYDSEYGETYICRLPIGHDGTHILTEKFVPLSVRTAGPEAIARWKVSSSWDEYQDWAADREANS